MNISNTILQIKQKLNIASHIADRIEKSGTVHPIDVDSLLEEIRSAYNKVYQLGWEEEETIVPEQPHLAIVPHEATVPTPVVELPVIPVEIPTLSHEVFELNLETDIENIVEKVEEVDIPVHHAKPEFEPEPEEEGPIAEVDAPSSTTIELDFEPLHPADSPVVAEIERIVEEPALAEELPTSLVQETTAKEKEGLVFSSESNTIQTPQEIDTPIKIIHPPVSDLRSALSINDKFSLSNKLFKGNGTDFNLSLNVLNGFENLTEAKNYLNSLKSQNNWDSESSEFQLLAELVERRYFRS
jgi:hypothetical protein